MDQPGTVSSIGIARLAGVGRAAVSNWRRRYADFPQPVGGTPTSPAFDLIAVEKWLSAQGKLQSTSATERAWRAIETASGGPDLGEALWLAGLALLNRTQRDGLTAELRTPVSLIEPIRRFDAEAAALLARGLPDEWLPRQHAVLSAAAELDDEVDAAMAFEQFYARYLSARGATSDYVTPEGVARLMLSLAGPAESVMDTACGTGTLLVEAARANGGMRCLGQDIDATAARITQVRLLFAGRGAGGSNPSGQVRVGDSLRVDAFPGERVDLVVCNPPFGLHDWADDQMAFDPRWEFGGLPPRTEPELAWVEDALAHLRPGGLAVVLMPPVAAWRSPGRRIRAELLRRGALRAVIALPPRLLPVTAVGLHLWILRRPIEGRGAGQVLLVDASHAGDGTPAAIADLTVHAWQTFESETFEEQAGVCKAVPVIDLLDEEVDVSPARHLASFDEVGPDPAALLATGTEVFDQLSSLRQSLPTLVVDSDARLATVRRVSLEELSRSGGVEILRGVSRIGHDPQESPEPAVTGGDVVRRSAPSGRASGAAVRIERGDVLIPTIASSVVATVATGEQLGARLGPNVSAVRVNPQILDPWFVAGMLTAPASLREAVRHSSATRDSVRVNLKRLQVPLLPLEEQRPYAEAFRRIAEFDTMLAKAADDTHRLAKSLSEALSRGTLAPDHGA
ncbi:MULTISPECIES: N-6 DNA methylase [unclassified Kribbella]|uniref:N-6 DNA methylase n=1 Tax=unclassified Kribbella TaxID=2644121 RepID=UPI003076D671